MDPVSHPHLTEGEKPPPRHHPLSLTEGEGQGEGAGAEATGSLEALAGLDTAEELLEFFGIEFDPEALAPRRVRLLKRYGMSVRMIAEIRAPLTDEERLRLHREALQGQWDRLMLETTCASSYYAKRAGGCAACGTHVAHEEAA
jgi:hypothetical protein